MLAVTAASLKLRDTTSSVHYIYTIGCDDYQLYQSVGLDYSWRASGNRGKLTRIVGGCKDSERAELLHHSPLRDDPDFAVYLVEKDLSRVPATGEVYPARARPYAIMLWLNETRPQADAVAILDPDFVFARPLHEHPDFSKVRPGRMFAQNYELGTIWVPTFGEQFGEELPEGARADPVQIGDRYSTGPPWVLATSDLQAMLPDWGRYTDGQRKEGDGLLREQNAFCMAACRHGIASGAVKDVMVSNPNAVEEAWSQLSQPQDWKPYILHYCSSYNYKQWSFHKAYPSSGWYAEHFQNVLPTSLECRAPMLAAPPAAPSTQEEPELVELKQAWMISHLLPPLSAAFRSYRDLYCPSELKEHPNSFGFVRTAPPTRCSIGDESRVVTRYRVKGSGEGFSLWSDNAAMGGSLCSSEAQQV